VGEGVAGSSVSVLNSSWNCSRKSERVSIAFAIEASDKLCGGVVPCLYVPSNSAKVSSANWCLCFRDSFWPKNTLYCASKSFKIGITIASTSFWFFVELL